MPCMSGTTAACSCNSLYGAALPVCLAWMGMGGSTPETGAHLVLHCSPHLQGRVCAADALRAGAGVTAVCSTAAFSACSAACGSGSWRKLGAAGSMRALRRPSRSCFCVWPRATAARVSRWPSRRAINKAWCWRRLGWQVRARCGRRRVLGGSEAPPPLGRRVVVEVGCCAALVPALQVFDECEWVCWGLEWQARKVCAQWIDLHLTRRCRCRGQWVGAVVAAWLHSGFVSPPPLPL